MLGRSRIIGALSNVSFTLGQQTRSVSSVNRRERNREIRRRFLAKVETSNASTILPAFETLYRELQRRAHPDTLRASHPHEADVNGTSMQVVNNLLTCVCESGNMIPDKVGSTLPFYLKPKTSSEDGTVELQFTSLRLDTTGKRKIKTSFENFFCEAGLGDGTGKFDWGNSYYKYPVVKTKLPKTFKP